MKLDKVILNEEKFILAAIEEAKKAYKKDEVPVGAVVVKEGKILSRGHNLKLATNDPVAHAEIVALRKAAKKLKNYVLENCDLYVTLEPCPMCAGAIIFSRIRRLVYVLPDPKSGACGSVVNLFDGKKFNHQVEVFVEQKYQEKVKKLLQKFFRSLR